MLLLFESKDIKLWFSCEQWKLHLFELEQEMKIEPLIKYVIYQVHLFR